MVKLEFILLFHFLVVVLLLIRIADLQMVVVLAEREVDLVELEVLPDFLEDVKQAGARGIGVLGPKFGKGCIEDQGNVLLEGFGSAGEDPG